LVVLGAKVTVAVQDAEGAMSGGQVCDKVKAELGDGREGETLRGSEKGVEERERWDLLVIVNVLDTGALLVYTIPKSRVAGMSRAHTAVVTVRGAVMDCPL